MELSDYLADEQNAHKAQGNPAVECNALYKTKDNLNCYPTSSQAVELARHVLLKAQLVIDAELSDAVVHLWNQGVDNERLYCGLNHARKGPRRKKGKTKAQQAEVTSD